MGGRVERKGALKAELLRHRETKSPRERGTGNLEGKVFPSDSKEGPAETAGRVEGGSPNRDPT